MNKRAQSYSNAKQLYMRTVKEYIEIGKLYRQALTIEDEAVREQALSVIEKDMTETAMALNEAFQLLNRYTEGGLNGDTDQEIAGDDDWEEILTSL